MTADAQGTVPSIQVGRSADEKISSRSDETRTRLLDAAAKLFAERGYAGTSMRAVTTAARASVSAANYHFGSKRALLHAVCQRQIGPLNEARMRALDVLEANAYPDPPELDDLLAAFLRSAVSGEPDQRAGQRAVVSRIYSDAPEVVAELKRELFAPVFERMAGLLERLFPNATADEITLAMQFTVGVLVHVAGGHLESGVRPVPRSDRWINDMCSYCAAGIRAQLSSARDRDEP